MILSQATILRRKAQLWYFQQAPICRSAEIPARGVNLLMTNPAQP
jgi:hypothetical protein